MPKQKRFQWTLNKIFAVGALVIIVGVLTYALIFVRTGGDENADNRPTPPSGQITVEGEYACLPKGDGPQTLECTLGLRTDDEVYYGLDLTNVGGISAIGGFNTGERARITGVVEEDESVYLTEGTIVVESVEEL